MNNIAHKIIMEAFIASHPFPSYATMIKRINEHPDASMGMAMFAEYGEAHHEALKAAYESGMKRDDIKRAGQIINNMGGIHAMRMNFYAFMYYSPFRQSRNEDLYYAYKQLEYGWDGIGDWIS